MEGKVKFKPDPALKLMDQVREVLRYHHYAYRTEQTYCDWIKRFLKFYDYSRHPEDMELGVSEIDSERMVLRVRKGKDGKDRDVPLPRVYSLSARCRIRIWSAPRTCGAL